MAIEDIDAGVVEVGGIDEVALGVAAERQRLVDGVGRRVVGGDDRVVLIDCGVPSRERAVCGGEDDAGRGAADILRDHEVGGAVANVAGGRGVILARRACGQRYLDSAGVTVAVNVVDGGESGPVVGDAEQTVSAEGNAPGVNQVVIRVGGDSRKVGNEVGL